MIESRYTPDKNVVFRENFESLSNTARLQGTATSVSYSNGIATFNGTSSRIAYTSQLPIRVNKMSIRVRAISNVGTATSRGLFGFWNGTSGVFIQTNINAGGLLVVAGGGNDYGYADYTITNRFEVVLVYDGTLTGNANRLKMYVDGIQKTIVFYGPAVIPASVFLGSGYLVAGDVGNTSVARFWNGKIGLSEVYLNALDSSEILALYNNSKRKNYNKNMSLSKWTKYSGSFTEQYSTIGNNIIGLGQKYFLNSTSGFYYMPISSAYGTLEFSFSKPDAGNILFGIGTKLVVGVSQIGYEIAVDSLERLYLRVVTGSSITVLSMTANSYYATNTRYRIRMTRKPDGVFTVWIKGGAFTNRTLVSATGGLGTNPVTNNTYTKAYYLIMYGYDSSSIADIQFYPYIK